MKIIIISELKGGGVEKVNLSIFSNLLKLKNNVKMVSLISNPNEFISYQKQPIYFLNKKNKRSSLFDLIKVLKKEKPDIILTSCLIEAYYSYVYKIIYSKKCKVMYAQHSVYTMTISKNILGMFRDIWIPKLFNIMKRLDGIIYVSQGVKNDMENYFKKENKNSTVIYNPVEIQREFHYKPYSNGTIHLVTAGRLEKEKNQELMLEVLIELKKKGYDGDLTIYGEGSLKEKIKEKAYDKNINDKVFFKGYTNDLLNEINKYTLFILTSKHESFGNVLVEAMSCGIPVVSSNCPYGPAEILENGKYGYLVDSDSPLEYANTIVEALKGFNKEKAYASFCRSQNFSDLNSVKKYLEFLKK